MKAPTHSSIEALEARIAPATFTVTSLADPSEAGKVTLRDALALADARPGADTIVFKLPAPTLPNVNTITLTGGGLESEGNVTITGPGAGKLMIDGGGNYRIFHFDDATATDQPVTVSGLSIVNGYAVSGAGIASTESLTLKSVVVANNIATGSNGGIEVVGDGSTGKKVSISNSKIIGNDAANFSGGVALSGVLSVAISKTVVMGNSAGAQNGGGIAVVLGSTSTGLVIKDSVIVGNSATSGGGLVLVNNNPSPNSKMVISGTKITGNTATSSLTSGGGGIFLGAGHTVISSSTISNNSSVTTGGGISSVDSGSLTISGSTIAANQTTDSATAASGGGLFVFRNSPGAGTLEAVKIVSSVFTGNQSGADGGGIWAAGGIALDISNSTFSNNNAETTGGGIFTGGTGNAKVKLTVVGGKFYDNVADTKGGGIHASGDGAISISSVKVVGNVGGTNGGGIMVENATAAVAIKSVVASGNFAGGRGGALAFSSVTSFLVSGGSFTGNGTAFFGGGIAIVDSTGSILGAAITGNAAREAGGVHQLGIGTVTLQIAKVIANSGRNGGNVFGVFNFV